MSNLKRHLQRLGYLAPPQPGLNFNDDFDDLLESAVARYQTRLGLQATGRLDPETISSIVSPRCGVSDCEPSSSSSDRTGRGALARDLEVWFLSGPAEVGKAGADDPRVRTLTEPHDLLPQPRGDPVGLCESLQQMGRGDPREVRGDVRPHFSRREDRFLQWVPRRRQPIWWALCDISRALVYAPDRGAPPGHGRLLGRGLQGPSRRLRELEVPVMVMDLESVAIHEIGHVLGLVHSSLPESVTNPVIPAWTKRTELASDDIRGIQMHLRAEPGFRDEPFAAAREFLEPRQGSI